MSPTLHTQTETRISQDTQTWLIVGGLINKTDPRGNTYTSNVIITINLVMESQPMDEASQDCNLCPQEVLIQSQCWLIACLLQ